jgi:DNA-binding response OmpR family regulator
MAEYDYSKLVVMLIDPDLNPRRLLRGMLARYGIDKLQEFPGTAEATAAFQATAPDLIVIDGAPTEAGDPMKWVGQIRHGHFPVNPFVPVMVVVWEATQPMLMRFASSGADDLLMKPFSQKQIADRLQNLVDNRRDFVVTSDYVGPDRRRSPREGQQVPLVKVPNTLRLKALGEFAGADVAELTAAAQAQINEQKVIRHGFQIAFLVEFARPGLVAAEGRAEPEKLAVEHLLRVPGVVQDLLRRLPEGGVRTQAERYGRQLFEQAERLRHHPATPLEDTEVLRDAGIGLAALTGRRTDLAAVEQEVQAAVSGYRGRLEQIAQAKAAASA